MAPNFPSAKLTLSCPLFAADFDPRNSDFLVVGGGGGEGRSGVGNRIASYSSFYSWNVWLVIVVDNGLNLYRLS